MINGFFTGIALLLIIVVFSVLSILKILEVVGKWKLYKKAGKEGWEAVIPFYSSWVLVEISGCAWWFFLLIFIKSLNIGYLFKLTSYSIIYNYKDFSFTLISLLALYCVNYNISKKCNKDYFYAIGLTILPFIFYPLLGFSNDKFNKKNKVSPYGVFKEGE